MPFDFGRDGPRIDKVDFSGVAGGLLALCCLGMILGVPGLRWSLLLTVGVGGVFGLALAFLRRR
ncbi:MAG: hypothetical protein AB7U83_12845 [Vicinamibacterales bacterium]